MLVARTVSRAESLTLRCSVLAISQMLVKEHSSSRIVANSGEVSDSVCSRPAAAILDARARMLAAQILSRAASLTLPRRMPRGHMTPIWASDALLPPGSISPIAKFAPAGSMHTVRTLNPICVQRPSQRAASITR